MPITSCSPRSPRSSPVKDEVEPAALEELKAKFRKAMDSDLNTSMGVTVLYDVLKAKTTDATKLAALDALRPASSV